LTTYGDLSCSVIDELPPGRQPVQTRIFYGSERSRAYRLLEEALCLGHQAYVVCPLIETSEALDLQAACALSETLQRDFFAHRQVGLLHGRLKREEKDQIIQAFYQKKIDILVATTIIEVGLDIPNATVMVIEHAERFGLAQLHQLRGRVGRGGDQSYCFLMVDVARTSAASARLQVMKQYTDGFKIAEQDLVIRGPGEFFGTRQSGLPELKIASPIRDAVLLETARREAFAWIDRDPLLCQPESAPLRVALENKWKGTIEGLMAD